MSNPSPAEHPGNRDLLRQWVLAVTLGEVVEVRPGSRSSRRGSCRPCSGPSRSYPRLPRDRQSWWWGSAPSRELAQAWAVTGTGIGRHLAWDRKGVPSPKERCWSDCSARSHLFRCRRTF